MILYDFAQNREHREHRENHENHENIFMIFMIFQNVSRTGPRHEKSKTHKVARTGPLNLSRRVLNHTIKKIISRSGTEARPCAAPEGDA